MSYYDWVFHSRVTDGIPPSNIQTIAENVTPLVGLASLRIFDSGLPAVATVAAHPNPYTFDTLIELGRIRIVFKKDMGLGFEDQGIFFLSSGTNPLLDEVEVYAVHYSSGSTTVRVTKYTNGLHDSTTGTLLQTYVVPFSGGNEPVVLEVIWEGGLFTTINGQTKITVQFGSNTTNFTDLVTLSPTVFDTTAPLFTGTCGFFVRSRGPTEPLDSVIDTTEIYRSNLA